MHFKIKYQDFIYIEDEHGELIEPPYWHNGERDEMWGSDNDEDSEYNEMMRINSEYDLSDYDNPDTPDFVHIIKANKYKITKKERVLVESKIVKYESLTVEYYNT